MRGGGVAGSQPMSTAVHRSPNKLWRSISNGDTEILFWLTVFSWLLIYIGSERHWLVLRIRDQCCGFRNRIQLSRTFRIRITTLNRPRKLKLNFNYTQYNCSNSYVIKWLPGAGAVITIYGSGSLLFLSKTWRKVYQEIKTNILFA